MSIRYTGTKPHLHFIMTQGGNRVTAHSFESRCFTCVETDQPIISLLPMMHRCQTVPRFGCLRLAGTLGDCCLLTHATQIRLSESDHSYQVRCPDGLDSGPGLEADALSGTISSR